MAVSTVLLETLPKGWTHVRACLAWSFMSCWFLCALESTKADWPAYRGNVQRTAFIEQEISAQQWEPVWKSEHLGAPRAAWPAPARSSLWQKLDSIEARVTDDVADVPLIVRDSAGACHVLVTSSANDRLICLDPYSGQLRWEVICEAPVRYAPAVADDRVFLGSDDGLIRAVALTSGEVLWQVQVGPDLPRIVGNGRVISPHPLRCSLLHENGVIYTAAGLFPSQGVYLVAVSADTGQLIWRRSSDRSPQGYLLAAEDSRLYVPAGRSVPFAIGQRDGQFIADLPSPGGSFCMLTPAAFFAGPGNSRQVQAQPQGASKSLSFGGRQVAAGGGWLWSANGTQLVGVALSDVADGKNQPQWSVDSTLQGALIASGNVEKPWLFLADGSTLEIRDGLSGDLLHSLTLNQPTTSIKNLAVSTIAKPKSTDGHPNALSGDSDQEAMESVLVATTTDGTVYAWRGIRDQPGSKPNPTTTQATHPLATTTGQSSQPSITPTVPDTQDAEHVDRICGALTSTFGLGLLIEDREGHIADSLLSKTNLTLVSVVHDPAVADSLRTKWQHSGHYGHRISVWQRDSLEAELVAQGLCNLVVLGAGAIDEEKDRGTFLYEKWQSYLADQTGVFSIPALDVLERKPTSPEHGRWLHQYATPANLADGRDEKVGRSRAFRLHWFGGVGPNRMPDRHLRGGAPLAAGGSLVMQGDGVLIGVDPANGFERWQRELPAKAMRYVMPYDGGYASLTPDGKQLFIATNDELWRIDALSGTLVEQWPVPAPHTGQHWGYVAHQQQAIYATTMNPAAPRTALDTQTRYTFVNNDYNSERPLVTSRSLLKLSEQGQQIWSYEPAGVLLNGSIAIAADSSVTVFIEARSESCRNHQSDQIPLPELMQEAFVVCLNSENGETLWEQALNWPDAKNMLYAQIADQRIVLSSSESENERANYVLRVLDLRDGSLVWEAKHRHIKDGLFHGEQVHHPVVLQRSNGQSWLIAEPYCYDLSNGSRIVPEGADPTWGLNRPGHSCGTLSGSGDCLFFRANHPTVLDLSQPGGRAFTALAPSRAGCWINMIPACGKLLIPEGSASCVCNYSLQTSMAFLPLVDDWEDANSAHLPNFGVQD